MQVSQLLKLGRGAIVELDRKVGEAIDIYVNNRLVARGAVVVVEEHLGLTMTEIIQVARLSKRRRNRGDQQPPATLETPQHYTPTKRPPCKPTTQATDNT